MGGAEEWAVEDIPGPDRLFMRVHSCYIKNEIEVIPGAFRDRGTSMSTDWEKYSMPTETRRRGKRPADNGVISLVVALVRSLSLSVEHDPVNVPGNVNRAHTGVIGAKDTEIRLKLARIYKWEIKQSD